MRLDKAGSNGSGKLKLVPRRNGHTKQDLRTAGSLETLLSASSLTFAVDDGMKYYP